MSSLSSKVYGLIANFAAFLAYVGRSFRLLYVVTALSLLALIIEYAATSLMIPMAQATGSPQHGVSAIWGRVAGTMGLSESFRTWLWLFMVLMSARLVLGYLLTVLTTLLGRLVHKDLSGKIFAHILLVEPMSEVYVRSIGHYITLAGDDTFKSGTIISGFLQSLIGLATALVGLFVLYQFSGYLFVAVIGFLCLSLFLVASLVRAMMRLNSNASQLSRTASTTFIEALNSLRSIRSLHGERFVVGTYAEQIAVYVRRLVELEAVKAGVRTLPAVVLLILASVLLRPGAEVQLADATLFAGTVIVIRIFAALGQMMTAGSQLATDLRAIREINALVNLSADVPAYRNNRLESVRRIELNRVTFGYGERGRVLDGVSFEFRAGQTYAIVGPSGAGKSTLADLLLGLSVPDSGSITINSGAALSDDVRGRFMLVEQQPKIFSTSVRDNLLLGAELQSEELMAALEAVNLGGVVRALPDGLETQLTYLGENFSGGQRQRLGIARALVRRPDVLILDEATSALDPETRTLVVSNLRERMRDGIIIFITHDPKIAALADEVLAIGEGPVSSGVSVGQMEK